MFQKNELIKLHIKECVKNNLYYSSSIQTIIPLREKIIEFHRIFSQKLFRCCFSCFIFLLVLPYLHGKSGFSSCHLWRIFVLAKARLCLNADYERLHYPAQNDNLLRQMLDKHIDLVDRRLLKNETIAHQEKVFSIFEPWVEWICKGKRHKPVELGNLVTSNRPKSVRVRREQNTMKMTV